MELEMKGRVNYRKVARMLLHLTQWITWNIIMIDWFYDYVTVCPDVESNANILG